MTSSPYILLRLTTVVVVLSGFAAFCVFTDPGGLVPMDPIARIVLLQMGLIAALTTVLWLLDPEIRRLLNWAVGTAQSRCPRLVRILRAISLAAALIGLSAAIVLSVLSYFSPRLGRGWPIPAALIAGLAGLAGFRLAAVAEKGAPDP